jgi:hypothetical protein
MAVVSDSYETKNGYKIWFEKKKQPGCKNLGEVGEDGKIILKFDPKQKRFKVVDPTYPELNVTKWWVAFRC